MIKSVEQYVMCSPLLKTGIQQERDKSGFTNLTVKKSLHKLEVVFGSEFKNLKEGDAVFVTAESTMGNSTWPKLIFDLEDKQFVMVPASAVVAVERQQMQKAEAE